jgi:hypothetical protein
VLSSPPLLFPPQTGERLVMESLTEHRVKRISILMEWENAILASDDRCCAMLRHVGEQIHALDMQIECLVLFNPQQVNEEEVRQAVIHQLVGDSLPPQATVRLEPIVGENYYELRNRGARIATGDVIVCIDSDVIPESGWLSALLAPMFTDGEKVHVAAGNTYLDITGLVSKAFAAGWFFPHRDEHDESGPDHRGFFANNVAFRRSVFLAHPYPPLEEGQTRGACACLAKELGASGLSISYVPSARVAHPAPHGWKHICVRALAHGRDRACGQCEEPNLRRVVRSFLFAGGGIKRTVDRVFTQRRQLNIAAWEIVPVVLLMAWYYVLTLVGALTTILLPRRYSCGWRI